MYLKYVKSAQPCMHCVQRYTSACIKNKFTRSISFELSSDF